MAAKGNRRPAQDFKLGKPSRAAPRGYVEVWPGVRAKPEVTIELRDEERDLDVVAEMVLDGAAQRYEVAGLHIFRSRSSPPMKDILKALPLQTFIDQATAEAVDQCVWVEVMPGKWWPSGSPRVEGEDEYVYVARIYRAASMLSRQPTKAVEDALGVATSTAAQKVGIARKLGLLPKTTTGKARA